VTGDVTPEYLERLQLDADAAKLARPSQQPQSRSRELN
jgi:hypothetical protein